SFFVNGLKTTLAAFAASERLTISFSHLLMSHRDINRFLSDADQPGLGQCIFGCELDLCHFSIFNINHETVHQDRCHKNYLPTLNGLLLLLPAEMAISNRCIFFLRARAVDAKAEKNSSDSNNRYRRYFGGQSW